VGSLYWNRRRKKKKGKEGRGEKIEMSERVQKKKKKRRHSRKGPPLPQKGGDRVQGNPWGGGARHDCLKKKRLPGLLGAGKKKKGKGCGIIGPGGPGGRTTAIPKKGPLRTPKQGGEKVGVLSQHEKKEKEKKKGWVIDNTSTAQKESARG